MYAMSPVRVPLFLGIIAALLFLSAFSWREEIFEPPKLASTNTPKQESLIVATTSHERSVAVSTSSAPSTFSASPWKIGVATVFWVGEGETDDNGMISNVASAWDEQWLQHFGGLDDPEDRCGFHPCAFTPKENPFYVALPYNDRDDNDMMRTNAHRIPWYASSTKETILKNRWVEVRVGSVSCFGQWEDVGPFNEDDIEYVFGDASSPNNVFGEKAGIDLSPALRDCLAIDGSELVSWRHVASSVVPTGPWWDIRTVRE